MRGTVQGEKETRRQQPSLTEGQEVVRVGKWLQSDDGLSIGDH